MKGTPTLYCASCDTFRAVEDWRERGEALVIQLEPCGHELRRSAAVEWSIPKAA
jgi:pyrimidine deaminase RibD-like protein